MKTETKDLLRLKNIVNELERREQNDNLSKYNTGKLVHKKQMEFHKNLHKNRWVFGGNRSGKTECGAVEVVWLARGIHPYQKQNGATCGWVVSLSTQVQRDVAQSKVLHYLNPDWIEEIIMTSGKKGSASLGVIDTIVVKNVFGTFSKIGFKSCDQGREKFQGTSLDYVWFDEEPPYDIYVESKMRVLDKGGQLFGTMTPLKGLTWVYNEIYLNQNSDPNVWHIHMEWSDNPFLNAQEVESLTSSLSVEELNSRKYGLFAHQGGLVYLEFKQEVHVIEPFTVPLEWYDQIALKQRDLMALIQGISTMDTFQESQKIMTEIENLKAQKQDAEKLCKQREMDIYRTEELRNVIKNIGTFEKFNGEIFKQLVEKILVEGNKATFVFNNMMKITKIVK